MSEEISETCPLCQRESDLTLHHLIPKKLHRRPFFQKNYKKHELNAGIRICKLCHKGLHRLFDEMTLAKQMNTIDLIRADETMARHIKWVSKQRGNDKR